MLFRSLPGHGDGRARRPSARLDRRCGDGGRGRHARVRGDHGHPAHRGGPGRLACGRRHGDGGRLYGQRLRCRGVRAGGGPHDDFGGDGGRRRRRAGGDGRGRHLRRRPRAARVVHRSDRPDPRRRPSGGDGGDADRHDRGGAARAVRRQANGGYVGIPGRGDQFAGGRPILGAAVRRYQARPPLPLRARRQRARDGRDVGPAGS